MSNSIHSKGNIYNLAKLAKQRLKQNNYEKNKVSNINNATSFANYIAKRKEGDVATVNIQQNYQQKQSYDEALYKKVCYLIEHNDTINPVSQLIDKELFASLDVEAKQFYINNLTQKYKFMKNKYYKEHTISLFW